MRIRTGCKVNLFLHILGVQDNGMHELASLFWPLTKPYDELEIYCDTRNIQKNKPYIHIDCEHSHIDSKTNTLTKAWHVYADATGFQPSIEITLYKGIPTGAGLGGGSADAATLLHWLDQENPFPIGQQRLANIATQVGADVPFFIYNQPCMAYGVGDKLMPCHAFTKAVRQKGLALVLVCPAVSVSTPWAYAAWDQAERQKNIKKEKKALTTSGELDRRFFSQGRNADECLNEHDVVNMASMMVNSFESVVFQKHQEPAEVKKQLLQYGALGAVMSGSGSSVVGLAESLEKAEAIQKNLELQGLTSYSQTL